MNPRESSIDILKILAMFMVAYYHCCWNMDYGYTAGESQYMPNFARILMNMCSVSVPLFFMCSGYCTLASASSGWKKMGMKVVTVLVLTLVWDYLVRFPTWFMYTLSALYLSTPVLRWFMQRCPRLFAAGVATIALATSGMNGIYVFSRPFAPQSMEWYHVQGLFTSYSLVYYSLGAWSKGRDIPLKWAVSSFVVGLLLSTAECSIMTIYTGEMIDGVNGSFPMLSTLFMTFGVFSMVRHVRLAPQSSWVKPLALISSGCLAVYIFHCFYLRLLTWHVLLPMLQCDRVLYTILTAVPFTLLVCSLSWCTGMLIRRIPYVRCLMKL